jgi:hypothetical protein
MCTSYDGNPNDARWDVFSLFSRPDFDYKPEIYKDYFAPVLRRGGESRTRAQSRSSRNAASAARGMNISCSTV